MAHQMISMPATSARNKAKGMPCAISGRCDFCKSERDDVCDYDGEKIRRFVRASLYRSTGIRPAF